MGRRQLIKRAGSLLKQASATETCSTSSSIAQSPVPIFSLRQDNAVFSRYLSTLVRDASAAGNEPSKKLTWTYELGLGRSVARFARAIVFCRPL